MEASQILQSTMLDIVFENRNKQYGAYELRKNYSRRTIKAITICFCSVAAIIGITSYSQQKTFEPPIKDDHAVVVTMIPDEPEPVIPPEPIRQIEQPPVATQEFVTIVVKPDEMYTEPISTQEDLVDKQISNVTTEGPADVGLELPVMSGTGDGKNIIEPKKTDDEPRSDVSIQAAFLGNWTRFLEKNLRPDVPVDNGAPAGKHKVMIEFVVDVDGSMSQIKAITNVGYGMEDEAIRVIKKAGKWSPAIWQGQPVKAYRRQMITFDISGED